MLNIFLLETLGILKTTVFLESYYFSKIKEEYKISVVAQIFKNLGDYLLN